jgi:uncharacterized protein
MKKLNFGIALLTFSLALSAQALDLDSARASKAIIELPTGYVQAASPSAKSLAEEVNAKRKLAYEGIAKKNGLTVDQVAAQAAKKIEENLKKGK